MMPDKISIIVFTCDRPKELASCLNSVSKQNFNNFELTVINNGNSQETDEILRAYNARVIRDQTKRLSYLFNLGWKNTDKEFITYLADDVEIDTNWLEQGLLSFAKEPSAAVVTGPLVSPFEFTGQMHALHSSANKNKFLALAAEFYDNFILEGKTFEPCILCESGSYTLGQGFEPNFKEEREVDLATTSSMLIRRSAIEAVGGFDENFIFNHADGDLFISLKKRGYKIIYNPRMRAIHHNRIGPSRYPFFIGRDTAYFYLKDIRPKTIKGLLAAFINIAILNIYWVYESVRAKDAKLIMGIIGFMKGVIDYIKK